MKLCIKEWSPVTKCIDGYSSLHSMTGIDFNPLQKDKLLIDWSRFKELADKINVTEKLKFVLGRGRKHSGKKRKCRLPAFTPFSTMFSKGFFPMVIKSLDCVVKS